MVVDQALGTAKLVATGEPHLITLLDEERLLVALNLPDSTGEYFANQRRPIRSHYSFFLMLAWRPWSSECSQLIATLTSRSCVVSERVLGYMGA